MSQWQLLQFKKVKHWLIQVCYVITKCFKPINHLCAVRTLGSYSDLLVIRHPESGSARQAAKFSKVPVINAGDGVSEHPTQVSILFESLIYSW